MHRKENCLRNATPGLHKTTIHAYNAYNSSNYKQNETQSKNYKTCQ
jgi:hypothetical protein